MPKTGWDYIIKIVSLISGGFVVFAKEIGTSYPKLNWLNSLWIRITLALIIILVPIIANKKIELLKLAETKENERLKDSTAKQETAIIEGNHRNELKELSLEQQRQLEEVMAKYGLKYDDAKKEIEKLVRDSSRSSPDPEIRLCDDGLTLDTTNRKETKLTVKLCCNVAPASNIDIKIYFALQKNNIKTLVVTKGNKTLVLPFFEDLGAATFSAYPILLYGNDFGRIFALVKGTYMNHAGTKTFNVNKLYVYNVNQNTHPFGTPTLDLYLPMI